jgi:chromosome segregation ATPase
VDWGQIATGVGLILTPVLSYLVARRQFRESSEDRVASTTVQEQGSRRADIDQILGGQTAFIERQAATISQLEGRLRSQDEQHEAERAEERRRHAVQLRDERDRADRVADEFRAHRTECGEQLRELRSRVEQAETRATSAEERATTAATHAHELAKLVHRDIQDQVDLYPPDEPGDGRTA